MKTLTFAIYSYPCHIQGYPGGMHDLHACGCAKGIREYRFDTSDEQALVCLSNREIADASRRCTFHCKMANNRLIAVFSLIVLASFI